MKFTNVTANAKANIYFDGKVVSHGITLEDGSTKTFGIMFPGAHHFGTVAAERMEVIDGDCTVQIDGSEEVKEYQAGTYFDVDANSGFTMTCKEGTCQYICSYL